MPIQLDKHRDTMHIFIPRTEVDNWKSMHYLLDRIRKVLLNAVICEMVEYPLLPSRRRKQIVEHVQKGKERSQRRTCDCAQINS